MTVLKQSFAKTNGGRWREIHALSGLLLALLLLCTGFSVETSRAQLWTTYTNSSQISGLASQGSELWSGTSGGVVHWSLPAGSHVKYTVSEGLADQWVKDVLVDAAGNRWFGTVAGVQKFDGTTWTTYDMSNSPLPSNLVYSLVQDLDGAIWFGTDFGCARFDGGDWDVYTNLGGGATNVAVRGIDVDSQNRIWTANNPDDYGDPGGVSMFDGFTWTHHDPDPGGIGQYFLSLTVDHDDNVWAGSWTNWLFVYNGSSWTQYTSSNSGLVGTNIEACEVETDGDVWVANHAAYATPTTGGVTHFDGSVWTSYTPANSGLPEPYVYAITVNADAAYFGTGRCGIAGFDGLAWNYYLAANEPHSNWYTSITSGVVGGGDALFYFGTDHAGIAVFDGADWSSYTSENSGLEDNYINDVHIHAGILWAASHFSGLWRYDGSSWQNYTAANSGLLGDTILSIDTDSQGTLWLGTAGWDGPSGQDGALAKFDGVNWTNFTLSNSDLIDDDNLQVTVDQSDIIWIGTEEGVSRFDGGSGWTDYDTSNSGLIHNFIEAIAIGPEGDKWFATRGGVSRLSDDTWTSYNTANGLPSNIVQDILVSEAGIVWIGTNDGVACFEEGEGWTIFRQSDGLGDDNVMAVGLEDEDTIWFGTYKSGVSVLARNMTGVELPAVAGPAGDLRIASWPNPFNPTTRISFELPVPGRARLSIYDVRGRHIVTLADELFSAGRHSVSWDGCSRAGHQVASGTYYVSLKSEGKTAKSKLVLLK